VVGVAPKSHREFADLLDQFEGFGALLGADHVAQDAAQQADVFDQGAFTVAFVAGLECAGAAFDRQGGFGEGLFHGETR